MAIKTPAPAGAGNNTLPTLIDAHSLAAMLGVAVGTISKDLTRAPHRLPPALYIPGRKGARWLFADVIAWLESLRAQPRPAKRRPGRPTKAEQIAHRRAAEQRASDER